MTQAIAAAIDIDTRERTTIQRLLYRHLAGVEVWAYGSRVRWNARPQSDLDLVAFAPPEQRGAVSQLREAFEESSLPFPVDLLIWDDLPESFHRNIEAEYVVFQVNGMMGTGTVYGTFSSEERGRRQVSIGELVDIKHGFAFKGSFMRDEPCGDVLLTPGNFAVGGGFKGEKFKYYDGLVPEEFVLNEGDLLVTMTDLSKLSDTLGYPAFVPDNPEGRRYLHNQRLGKVSLKSSERVDTKYLYYVMCTTDYRHEVLASATGTTVKHTSPDRIKQFRFMLPPLPEQRAITHILGTLDVKIELNRRMNQTLEEMARAIFQDWFVDFGPVRAKLEGREPYLPPELWDLFPDRLVDSELGEVPEGWEVRALGDFGEIVTGKTPSTRNPTFYSTDVPFLKIPDMHERVYAVDTQTMLSLQGASSQKGKTLPPGEHFSELHRYAGISDFEPLRDPNESTDQQHRPK